MGAVPFAQFYWTDFFADTLQLDGHESGAYLMLLGAAWVADGCKLPDDDRKLARCARLTVEQWREVRDAVLQYWVLKDGFWTQKRLSIEHAKAVAKLEKLRTNGAKGGRPKALTNAPNKPNGSGQKNQKPSKRAIESESESEKKNSSPKNSLTLTDAEKVSAAGDGSSLGLRGRPPLTTGTWPRCCSSPTGTSARPRPRGSATTSRPCRTRSPTSSRLCTTPASGRLPPRPLPSPWCRIRAIRMPPRCGAGWRLP